MGGVSSRPVAAVAHSLAPAAPVLAAASTVRPRLTQLRFDVQHSSKNSPVKRKHVELAYDDSLDDKENVAGAENECSVMHPRPAAAHGDTSLALEKNGFGMLVGLPKPAQVSSCAWGWASLNASDGEHPSVYCAVYAVSFLLLIPLSSCLFDSQAAPRAAPAHWEEVWRGIEHMRREGVAQDAPTDRTGATEIGNQIRQAAPPVYRFQTLAGLILSAQTKDPDTAKAVAALREYSVWEGRGGFTPDNVLATDVRTLTKLISDATYAEKKAEYVSARTKLHACNLMCRMQTH